MSDTLCEVPGCEIPRPREVLMCTRHWGMVPREVKTLVVATFTHDEDDLAWQNAKRLAVAQAQDVEGLWWDDRGEIWCATGAHSLLGWDVHGREVVKPGIACYQISRQVGVLQEHRLVYVNEGTAT